MACKQKLLTPGATNTRRTLFHKTLNTHFSWLKVFAALSLLNRAFPHESGIHQAAPKSVPLLKRDICEQSTSDSACSVCASRTVRTVGFTGCLVHTQIAINYFLQFVKSRCIHLSWYQYAVHGANKAFKGPAATAHELHAEHNTIVACAQHQSRGTYLKSVQHRVERLSCCSLLVRLGAFNLSMAFFPEHPARRLLRL